jgi:hypothetical protein
LDCEQKELLQEILELELYGVFPNITIAFRIFVSLPASMASRERTFSALKQVKNYCRSTTGQDPFNGNTLLFSLLFGPPHGANLYKINVC